MSTETASPAERLSTLPPGLPDLTLGYWAAAWAEGKLSGFSGLIQPNGSNAGKPFRFTMGQLRFLLWWYAVDENGRWLFNHGVRRLAKGSGKSPFAAVLSLIEFCAPVRLKDFDSRYQGGCVGRPVDMPLVQIAATAESQPLALDTPVPTPSGERTIGDLEIGDQVFDSRGEPVEVARTTPVLIGEDCYRLTFDDGEEIVASGSHGWTLLRASSHDRTKELVSVTTAEMAKDYLQASGHSRYSMPPVALRYGETTELAVDPYLLGLWLGDGSTSDSSIAYDTKYEADVLRLVEGAIEEHEEVRVNHGCGRQGRLRIRRRSRLCRWGHDWRDDERRNGGEHVQCGHCLRERSKKRDRKPLLTLRERLREIGVLGNKHIPDSYLRAPHDQRLALLQGLIDSDGTLDSKGRAMFVNRDLHLIEQVRTLVVSLGYKVTVLDDPTGARRVFFNPKDGRLVARLPYKVARHRVTEGGSSKLRYIRKVERVSSVPVRCIGIDTDDHLFVVGRCGTLTHNTANTMRMVRAFAPKGSPIVEAYNLDVGKTKFYKLPEGTLEVITSSATAAEGGEGSFIVADETEHWRPNNGGVELASTLEDNLAKSGSRMMETSNAWVPGMESVAEDTWEAWLVQEEGRTKGARKILYDAVIAPPDTDMADRDSLAKALEHVYGDCPWVDIENIIERIWSPKARPDESKRKYLNWPTVAQDAWVTPEEWMRLADRDVEVPEGAEVVLFFDGSKSRDATALVGCEVDSGHVFTLGVWEPDPNDDNDTVDVADVDRVVEQAFERYSVLAFFGDVKEWESFVYTEWPARYKDDLLLWAVPQGKPPQPIAWDMRTHAAEFAKAAEACHAEIMEGQFTHDGNSAVTRHVINARRRPHREWVSIGKESKDSPRKIDAAVCVIGARMVRRLVLGSGKRKPKRSGKAMFVG